MTTLLPVLLALVSGCKKDDDTAANGVPVVGTGLFAEGCPAEGRSLARVIGVDAMLPGRAAVGTRGDLLLANQHASFVITDAVGQATYWYYGGALADAVPMDGCTPGEDKLDDVGFVLAELNLVAYERSIIRGFRADRVEVLADGSDGGAAIVRATGTDDLHWLVEHTLINGMADDGGRPRSETWGTEVAVDYILEPDSPTLRVEISVTNPTADKLVLAQATLISYGDTLERYAYAQQRVEVGGFGFDAGIPWVLATDGSGALLWGADDASLAFVSIAGVNVIIDMAQVTSALAIDPGATQQMTYFFVVGDGGGASALEPLLAVADEPLTDQPASAGVVSGTLRDEAGKPLAGQLRVETRAPGGEWGVLDRLTVRPDGAFRAVVPAFGAQPWEFRVVGEHPGRDDSAPVDVSPGDAAVEVDLGPAGRLDHGFTDGEGGPSPARLHLQRSDGLVRHFWLVGDGTIDVPPGTWTWTATRGYEHPWSQGEVVIPDGGSASIQADLPRVVDTTGWMSFDTHVHTSDSPDSDISPEEQLVHAAAHGLDVVLHTEHENIVDRRAIPADVGVASWVNNAIGEEVTSVGIEHMTMFPVEPDGSPRGGYVEWYGMDIDQLFGAMRDRSGGGVNLLNHPSYLDMIGWDPVAAAPTLTDPTLLALEPTSPLWSWDLDGVEVMNGHGDIFATGNRRFDNWQSMVNAGHEVVAVGCSDDHEGWEVGFPRSYYASPTDDVAEFDVADAADAFRHGEVISSAGGFARVAIDGQGPGGLVTDTDGFVDLDVHVEALPAIDVTHVVVFVNCDQVDSVLATAPDELEKLDTTLTIPVVGDGQVVIAAFGTTRLAPGLPQYDATRSPRVLTNPIFVDGDGDGLFSAPGGRICTYDTDVSAAR